MTLAYVPGDAAAVAVGADDVADALRGLGADVVRTGSRGMLWLEPLVEVPGATGRDGYAAVRPEQAPALLDLATSAHRAPAADDPAYLGVVDEHPWLARQDRLTTARLGIVDPADPDDYGRLGGWAGLRAALTRPPADVVEQVVESGLRGRGGAGFPTGVKWRTVAATPADVRFVAVNVDEGDSGTFADRMLLEGDPFALLEGMAIAAHAVGASEGYVYVRSEYPHAIAALRTAIRAARDAGCLGADILGSGLRFDVEVRVGAGAYICGEETSMLESIEGRRGEVRAKPPIPAVSGLWGRPTLVNNLLTMVAVPTVLAEGSAAYAAHGTGRSRGTQVFQLAGNIRRGGLVEVGFGVTLRELVEDFGGGTRSGRPVRAVQVGGPLGAYVPADQLDVALDYESMAQAGFMLGHGGIVVFDDTVDMAAMARFAMEFCAKESCGKCTPCRIGSVRGVETIDRIRSGRDVEANIVLLQELCETMERGSLCAMGGLTPMPVRGALSYFPEDFDGRDRRTDGVTA